MGHLTDAEPMPAMPFIGWLGLVIERYEPDHASTRDPFGP